ncbi:MAG: hypothetical protein U0V64_06710 [Cyclobacteriaceae bacterium]
MLFLLLMMIGPALEAQQQTDSTLQVKKSRIVRSFMGMISHEEGEAPDPINMRSEDLYRPYEGAIVRRIIIQHLGFERILTDTTQRFQTLIAQVANGLHADTRNFAIRQNLFVKEGRPLDAYGVADNERTLRTLPFVMDARIYVKSIPYTTDSVDLVVVTRDVFSIGASFEPDLPNRYQFSLEDNNLMGMGQRIRYGGLVQTNRNPHWGHELFYQKTNLMGSFVDATVGFTQTNSGPSIGRENETSYYLRLNRTLYHPLVRWAGGVEVSNNFSTNVFMKPDTAFAHYRYNLQDYWAGYSFGHSRHPGDLRQDRTRNFIAVRGFQQFFYHTPDIELKGPDKFIYRTRVALLGQLTFFRQDYYKTQYVVGFGRTEDIPYGYRFSLTAGWEKELDIARPYAGAELYYNKVYRNGAIWTYTAKLATYHHEGGLQDGLLSAGLKRYSRLYTIGRMKARHQSETSVAALFNQRLKPGLDIRDGNGITAFRPDSLSGTRKITLSEEAVLFTYWKVLGFHLAPIIRVDLALINHTLPSVSTDNLYAGFSAGLRARNENLIFNTVEARVFYFPKVTERLSPVSFQFTTNLLIRYPTNLVSRPATVFNP